MSFWSNRVDGSVNVVWRLIMRLWWRVLIIAGSIYAGYRLRTVIITLFVSAIIAYVLDPAVEWLCHQRSFTRFHSNLFGFYGGMKQRLAPRARPLPTQC